MKQLLDEIEIPMEGLLSTKQEATTVLHELQPEAKIQLLKRFFFIDLRYYLRTAGSGILLLLIAAYLFPSSRIITVLLYFLLLGALAMYELYKQYIYNAQELLSVVCINPGRCFLYKCIMCAFIQFICFLIILLIEAGIFQESPSDIILSSILPVYFVQCVGLLFERWIHSISNVLVLYVIGYGSYFYFIFWLEPNIPAYLTLSYTVPTFVGACVLLSVLLFLYYRKSEKGGSQVWDLH